jgi:hypothetical protein
MDAQAFPDHDDELSRNLALLRSVEEGRLDDLICPSCRQPTISVWFTNPTGAETRTWFLCRNCRFRTRVQNVTRPKMFSPARVNQTLEELDRDLLSQRRFDEPPR